MNVLQQLKSEFMKDKTKSFRFSVNEKEVYECKYTEGIYSCSFELYKNKQWKGLAYSWEETLRMLNDFIGLECGWKVARYNQLPENCKIGYEILFFNEEEEKVISTQADGFILAIEKRKFDGELIENKKMLISEEERQFALFSLLTAGKKVDIQW